MNQAEFIKTLEGKLEQPPGTLAGDTELQGLEDWDSLAKMAFIVLADQQFGCRVTGSQLAGCKTVDDLVRLLGDHIEV